MLFPVYLSVKQIKTTLKKEKKRKVNPLAPYMLMLGARGFTFLFFSFFNVVLICLTER